jgi:hypothetical protein
LQLTRQKDFYWDRNKTASEPVEVLLVGASGGDWFLALSYNTKSYVQKCRNSEIGILIPIFYLKAIFFPVFFFRGILSEFRNRNRNSEFWTSQRLESQIEIPNQAPSEQTRRIIAGAPADAAPSASLKWITPAIPSKKAGT